MEKACASVVSGGIVQAAGPGDGPGHRQSALAKLCDRVAAASASLPMVDLSVLDMDDVIPSLHSG